jgi:DNA-directed RNA polymerase I and III subunit RPAC1
LKWSRIKKVNFIVLTIQGLERAKVVNPRIDTVSRECLRHSEFDGKVELSRIRDHFICNFLHFSCLVNVESTGILPPNEIFKESLLILIQKCKTIKDNMVAGGFLPSWQLETV